MTDLEPKGGNIVKPREELLNTSGFGLRRLGLLDLDFKVLKPAGLGIGLDHSGIGLGSYYPSLFTSLHGGCRNFGGGFLSVQL